MADEPLPLAEPIDTPPGFAVTPGLNDINHGSDAEWDIEKVTAGQFRGAPLGSVINTTRFPSLSGEVDEGFDPWGEIKGTKYESRWKSFVDVYNARDSQIVKARLDAEEQDRQEVAKAPWYVSLPIGLAAGILDPTALIPGGAFVRGAKGGYSITKEMLGTTATLAREGGYSMGRSAIELGMYGGVAGLASEGVLQQTQIDRSGIDTALNVGGSVLLSGLLGAAGAKLLNGGEYRTAAELLDRAARVSGSDPIFSDILGKLTAAGIDPQEAKVDAAIVAARYQTRGKRMGKDPLELYQGEGIELRAGDVAPEPAGGSADATAGRSFNQERRSVLEAQTSSAAFKRWFGESKVVDESGSPLVVYHGTADTIHAFDLAHPNRKDSGWLGNGVYVTTSPDIASSYSLIKDGSADPSVMPLFARLENPYYATLADKQRLQFISHNEGPEAGRAAADAWTKELKAKGHDGVILEYRAEDVGAANASREIVVFDPAGVKSATGNTGAFDASDPRVAFQRGPSESAYRGRITLSDNRAVIDLFTARDASTFMHEASHLWLEELVRDASSANAPQQIKDDLATVLKWLGIDDARNIQTPHQEQWASAFERYLADGRAPSSALKAAFERFKEWMAAIYKSLTDIGATVPADIRQVMDRMLATDAQIAGAKAGEGVPGPTSAGAAAVMPLGLAENTIAGRAGSATARATRGLNPVLRLMQSASAAVRDVAGNLFENGMFMKMTDIGRAQPQAVETYMKQWNGGLAKAIRATDDGYSAYRKGGGTLRRTAYREEIGRAMRNNDTHAIPEVEAAAKAWRKEVFDPLKKEAIDMGLLPADVEVETAPSYFSRMWNRQRLIAREPEFKDIVSNWVTDNLPKWAQAYDKGVERRLNPLRREIDELELGKLRRAEERRIRDEGGEVDAGEFTEGDIRNAINIVKGGAPKPKGVKRLTQFVREAGGLYDPGGDVRHMGLDNKSMPGMLRTNRKSVGGRDGGWSLDDMAHHAWEHGYFPDHGTEPPSINDFLEALGDDFNKRRAVVSKDDQGAYRLTELVDQIQQDLERLGVSASDKTLFSTSEEVKGMVHRVHAAQDAQADEQIKKLKETLLDREVRARSEREGRFIGDPAEMGRKIGDEVFDTLTGKNGGTVRPEFLKISARGPLKERTFNIPDELIPDFLHNDVVHVGQRYVRVVGADVELARKFGRPDMVDQIQKIHDDYRDLRARAETEGERLALDKAERKDIADLEYMRDLLRGTRTVGPYEQRWDKIIRGMNHFNYLRTMGEVVIASLTDPVRVAMVHGLSEFMSAGFAGLGNLKAIKMSVAEAKRGGQVLEGILGHRLATLTDILDPYSSRGPTEAFLENMTRVASNWNGIRIWTDAMKSMAAVITQNRILRGSAGHGALDASERRYLAYLGIDQSMAERIAGQFATHGEDMGGIQVAHTEHWEDPVAVRAFHAALNKDVDSTIIQRSVADIPVFGNTPTGRAILQFKSFALASHQRQLIRGLQESPTRFIGGVIAMTTVGMMMTYLKALSQNQLEKLPSFTENPGWWIAEGLDKAGILAVPMEISNAFEKMTGFNPVKAPLRAFDKSSSMSIATMNRGVLGALLGPSVGLAEDIATVAGTPMASLQGKDVSRARWNAGERLIPFSSYYGLRQLLKWVIDPALAPSQHTRQ